MEHEHSYGSCQEGSHNQGDCRKEGFEGRQSKECCPEEKATEKWMCAFHKAMMQAHVEVLKAKILKSWGTKLDKSADVVLEVMEKKWKAILEKSSAKAELKERI